MFRLFVQVYPIILIYGFLTESTNSGHPDVLKDVLELMVDEKNLRHQLETTVMQLKHEVDGLKQNLSNHENEITKLKQENNVLRLEMQSTPRNYSGGQLYRNNASVGFTARLPYQKSNYSLSANEIFPFAQVIYNTDTSFNPSTGIFTCPRSGLYMFSVSVISNDDLSTSKWATLQRNGGAVVYVNSGSHQDERGSAVAVIHLDVGDEVSVKNTLACNYRSESYFSGALISPQ